MTVKTTCPYCGVGCGVLAEKNASGAVTVRGDPLHPANFGRLCSKGSALAETVDLAGRLLAPSVDGRTVGWDEALDVVAERFGRVIREHGPDAVAFYVSGQLLTEDYYVVNKLAKGFVGTANIDTNSRLCMASSVAGHKRAFGSDTVPGCYEDLEEADLLVLVGSNAAWCHPILHQRMLAAKERNPACRIVVIDPRRTATCEGADLHLPLRSGSDAVLFNGLLADLIRRKSVDGAFVSQSTSGVEDALEAVAGQSVAATAATCGLSEGAVELFYAWFAGTERVVTLYSQGINQSTSGVDKVNAIINCHLLTGRIGRPGMGPFSLTGQPNAMGGREVGGLANQLAAHMEIENAAHRELVQRFWGSPAIASRPGLKAVDMFEDIAQGRIKAVWIMSTNPAVSLPDANRVNEALEACEFVVVSDCVRDTDTTRHADVLLPALAWGEKDGTVTNSERRISRQRPFLPKPGVARADWQIVCDVARRMGYSGFDFGGAADIFREHAALSGFENDGARDFDISRLSTLDDRAYDGLTPMQWPVTREYPAGTARMFETQKFFTPDRKARFVPVTPRPPKHATDRDHPLVLNTGRIRDHWHTMTRTGKSARLSAHMFEPCGEFNPEDARAAGLEHDALARLTSPWGEMVVRVAVSAEQRRGCVFVPMHWNGEFAGEGLVNALVNPATDPVSGQPESKHTPLRAAPYTPKWHVFILNRERIARPQAGYWVQGRVGTCFRMELAFEERPASWRDWARAQLGLEEAEIEWIAYRDPAAGRFRYAAVLDGRLEGCVFIAPDHRLVSRSWLIGLFAEEKLSPNARMALLAGRPFGPGEDIGPIVCSCFGVGRNQIRAECRNGAGTVEAIGRRLKAGTNCGACKPEIGKLLAPSRQTPPESGRSGPGAQAGGWPHAPSAVLTDPKWCIGRGRGRALAPRQHQFPEESFMSALPLSGIKILDLTRVLAGPLSAQMLGDLGAEVIKIERPGTGDDARAFGPPYLTDPEGRENNNNSFYLCANRNKKSVTVNIAKPEGQAIIRELAKDVDVFMENYKVGDLKRYGLDYETIKAINPGIIYCSVTGFGQTGPYAPRAGYDAILQAMGGLMSVTGHIDGEPGEGPMKVGPSIVDYMTGMNTSIGILAALYHRDANGGQGQRIDVCLFDTVIASLSHWLQIYLVNGKMPPRRGTWGNGGMPAGVFRCTDGELMLVVGNDGQFQRTCAVLGEPELANDKRFIKNNDRVVHGKEIMAIFAGLFLKKPVAYWLEKLEEAGVPSGPINNFEQVFSDPHVQSRGMRVKVNHPFEPDLSLIRNALTLSETPITEYRAPPRLGENTSEVLGEKLGYDAAKIESLKKQGVI